MRRILTGLLAAALLSAPALADTKDEVTGVIQNQLDAFLADDFDTAFTYASPRIKRMFGSPDRFGMMVRQGYPMVWRPADVQYLDLSRQGPYEVQKVLITDETGATHVLEYRMIETPDGWQIAGVRLLEAPGVGA